MAKKKCRAIRPKEPAWKKRQRRRAKAGSRIAYQERSSGEQIFI